MHSLTLPGEDVGVILTDDAPLIEDINALTCIFNVLKKIPATLSVDPPEMVEGGPKGFKKRCILCNL